MTTPTQAQKEAALKRLSKPDCCFCDTVCLTLPCKCIEDALTAAAAEAGEQQSQWDKGYHAGFHAGQASIKAATIERCAQVAEDKRYRYGWETADAIRAMKGLGAAEAGERDENWDAYAAGLKDGKAATIERCAQVAETYFPFGKVNGKEIAAAIRVMKD